MSDALTADDDALAQQFDTALHDAYTIGHHIGYEVGFWRGFLVCAGGVAAGLLLVAATVNVWRWPL